MLFEARRDGAEVFELVEEAFDEIAQPIEEWAERRDVHASRHWLDIAPGALRSERFAQSVAVVAAICEEDLAFADPAQHVGGALAVMRLAFGQLQGDRQSIGVDERMDFRRQPAARAPHASACSDVPSGGLRVVRAPFLPLAPC